MLPPPNPNPRPPPSLCGRPPRLQVGGGVLAPHTGGRRGGFAVGLGGGRLLLPAPPPRPAPPPPSPPTIQRPPAAAPRGSPPGGGGAGERGGSVCGGGLLVLSLGGALSLFVAPPRSPPSAPGPRQAVLRVALKGEAQFAVLGGGDETGGAARGGLLWAVPPPGPHQPHQPGLFLPQPSQPPPAERGVLLHQPAQPRCRPLLLLLLLLLAFIPSAAPAQRLRAFVLRGGEEGSWGVLWCSVGLCGSLWLPMRPRGSTWFSMGPYCSLWVSMRALWFSMGLYCSLWGPYCSL